MEAADVENLKATELRLGLPGTEEAVLMPTPPSTPRAGSKRALAGEPEAKKPAAAAAAPPAAKARSILTDTCCHGVLQGSGGGMAAGEVVQEELPPDERQEQASGGGAAAAAEGGGRRRAVREGEHGRGAVPEEDRPQDVQGLPRAEGGPRGHVPLLLRRRRRRRLPVGLRRHLRRQGRRPHARRRRAIRDVHKHLQEVEDYEGV
uniref:Uncharacterized protein n=1 Tax=Oryza brachyantha TaxID=4533 RepID=J3NER5_ORYBR